MDNKRLNAICKLGMEIHKGIERKLKVEERVEWLLKNCNDADREYYSNFKLSGIVGDIYNELEEEELEPTTENIDSVFEGLWE